MEHGVNAGYGFSSINYSNVSAHLVFSYRYPIESECELSELWWTCHTCNGMHGRSYMASGVLQQNCSL